FSRRNLGALRERGSRGSRRAPRRCLAPSRALGWSGEPTPEGRTMKREIWNSVALVAGVVALAAGGPWLVHELRTLPRTRVAEGKGCLKILSERLRQSPGIIAIEANFRDNTLSVRYQSTLVGPDDLNALADEVAAMFAQRVTYCERRNSLEACEECALRLGRVPEGQASEFEVTAEQGRIGLSPRRAPAVSDEMVRPIDRRRTWRTSVS